MVRGRFERFGTRWPARKEARARDSVSRWCCAKPRLGEDLCVDSLAAPAALVREDAFDIAPRRLGCVRTYDDMVTLVQERVETRQLAAD